MAVRLLIVSDTHIPVRARAMPAPVLAAADAADLIVHAGDWVHASVLDGLLEHGDVLGVWGNNDGADLRARLPEVARREIEGVRFAVVHETGAAGDAAAEPRVADRPAPAAAPHVPHRRGRRRPPARRDVRGGVTGTRGERA